MATSTTDAPAPPARGDDPAPPRIYYGYWLVGVAFIAQFVAIGAMNYVFGPFLVPMTEDLGWARWEYTTARFIGQIAMGIIGLFIGAYVDRHGGRMLMRAGVCTIAVAMLATSQVQETWQWWILNGIVLTAGSAMSGNLIVSVMLSRWFVEQRGRVIGLATMGVSFAGVVLTPATTELITAVGWRAAWQILAVGALVIILPLSFLVRRAPEDHGLFPDGKTAAQVAAGGGARAAADFASSLTRAEALRTPAFYLVAFAFGLGGLSIGVVLFQAIPFMTDAGHSTRVASLMITVTSVPSFALKPVWGWLIDRGDAQRLSIVGFVLTSVAMVLIVLGVRAEADAVAFFGFFVLGCGWGGFMPLQEVVWASFFGRRYLGAVRSAGLPVTLFLGAIAPLLASMYYDAFGNYDGAFLAVGACSLISIVLILFAKRPTRVA